MAQLKYLDLTGLKYFWGKIKTQLDTKVDKTTTVNGQELSGNITLTGDLINVGGDGAYNTSNLSAAIDSLDKAVKAAASKAGVTSFGGKTGAITLKATSATPGDVNLSMTGNELTATIEGWNTKSDSGHTHVVANITDLNDGWDALLKAAPNIATKSHTHNTSDVTGLDTALAGKAAKSEALGTASLTGSGVKLTFTANTVTPGQAKTTIYTIPTSGAGTLGVITHETVKQLAGEVAGSVYRVKGSLPTYAEVLKISNAQVGDVYNVEAAFEVDDMPYPAGTNVVCTVATTEATGNEGKWDPLGGTIDLTPYAKTSDVASTYATKASISDMLTKTVASSTYATKTELSSGLAGKADKSHTHTLENITDLNSGWDTLLKAAPNVATASHTHTTAQITDLQGKLDAKLNTADLVAITTGEIDALF